LRLMIKLALFSLFVMVFLSGCNSNSNSINANDDLFQYKGSYVGDNSAVVNSVLHLQGEKYFSGIELKTKEEPYGIIVTYDWSDSELNEKETIINNASYLFALIQNVDWITFQFEMVDGVEEYKMTREYLQKWYGVDLNGIEDEDELKELIQEALKDENKVIGQGT